MARIPEQLVQKVFRRFGASLSFAASIICLAISALVAPGWSQSPRGLRAAEPFSFPSGPLDNTGSGFGWAGPWFTQNHSAFVPGYDAASSNPLSYNGLSQRGNYATGGSLGQTTGRHLDVSTTGPFADYLTAIPYGQAIGKAGTTLWTSVLLRKDANPNDELSVTVLQNGEPWWAAQGQVSFGYFGGASVLQGIGYWSLKINGTIIPSTVPMTIGQTALMVLRLEFGSTTQATLYVNPTPGTPVPIQPSAQGPTASAITLDSIAFYGGDDAYEGSIDEIRLASDYASAVPVPGLLAYEPFNVLPGPLLGANSGTGWAEPWNVSANGTTFGFAISAGSLSYLGLPVTGNSAVAGYRFTQAGRRLDTSATGNFGPYLSNGSIGAPGTTLWTSLLLQKNLDNEDESYVAFHNGSLDWWNNVPDIEVGYFGWNSRVNNTRYWSISVAGVVYRSAVPLMLGQPALLVLRIDFGPTNAVSLYVNPVIGQATPGVPDAQATTIVPLAFSNVAFGSGWDNNATALDEVRIASDYQSVLLGTAGAPSTPTGLVTVSSPGSVTLAWYGVGPNVAYQVWRSVNGSAPTLIATVSGTTFTDSTVVSGSANAYFLIAQNSAGTSAASATVEGFARRLVTPKPTLGANLSAVVDWTREWPFVDIMKLARPWIPQQMGSPWGQGPALQLTAEGWPAQLAPGQYAETLILDNALDDSEASFPTGNYNLYYDGEGHIRFDLGSATIVSQAPGHLVVNVSPGPLGIFLIVDSTNSANPLRNIRFVMPGFETGYQTQPFHPTFLSRLTNLSTLRFMEWMMTNNSTVQAWTDRPLPTDYTFMWRGVALETMIQLANNLHVSPWFNIPAQASDDYVLQFATLVKQQLDPSLSVYIEYSNETWNGIFAQNSYVSNQGLSLKLSQDPTLAAAYYTAQRSVQIFQIWQNVFGNTSHLVRVLPSQAVSSWMSDQIAGFNYAYGHADALAIAPYYSICSDLASGGWGFLGDPSTASTVAALTVDQVLDIETAHIQGCALTMMQSQAAIAKKYGLRLVAYEGGQHLVALGDAQNNTQLASLFKAANRSPRMSALYTAYLNNWISVGGDTFNYYADVTAYTKYGSFGALEYQDQDRSAAPKYQALSAFAAQNR